MKVVIKKDLKKLLPGFAMYVMAGIALLIIASAAVFIGNINLTVTALYLFFIAGVVAIAYFILKGSMLFRKNLLDEAYLKDCLNRGCDYRTFMTGKILCTFAESLIILTEYTLFLLISLKLALAKLPEISDELGSTQLQLNEVFGTSSKLNWLGAYFELLFLIAALTGLSYLAFGLCYTYFMKGKYAIPASLMTLFCVVWIFWKIFDFLIPQTGLASVLGSIIYTGVIAVAVTIISIQVVSKKRFELI
jgi:hypothetical protein